MGNKNNYKIAIIVCSLLFLVMVLLIVYNIYSKSNTENTNTQEQTNIESNETMENNNSDSEPETQVDEIKENDEKDDDNSQQLIEEAKEPEKENLQEEPVPLDEAFSYKGLVELTKIDPTFLTDIKNASTDNITGVVQYEYDLALVNIDMVEPLMKAQKLAMADGYRIKIWDAYRPISVQKAMNDILPADKKKFVPAPSNTSQHCRGIAVDVTLVDENGEELDMPTGYCEFSEASYPNYKGATEVQTKNREYLKKIMSEAGLKVLSNEWWHYYLPTYQKYERLDVRFTEYVENRDKALGLQNQ